MFNAVLLLIWGQVHHKREFLDSNCLSTREVYQAVIFKGWSQGHSTAGSVCTHDSDIEHVSTSCDSNQSHVQT